MDDLLIWAVGISLGGGFVLSAVGTAIVRRIALRRQFVDHPGGHKSHTDSVALGGGISITLALISPIVLGFIFLRFVCDGGEAPAWVPEALRVHLPGLLSQANAGPGTDGSQFFLTFVATPHLDDKHTIYGEVVDGMETVKEPERWRERGSPHMTEPLLIEKAEIRID